MAKPLTVGKTDLLRSKLVQPGWYPATIKSVTDAVSKTTGVEGWNVEFIINKAPYDGVPITGRYWENAPGFSAPLIAAITGKPVDPEGGTFDLEKGVGKQIMIYVVNGIYNNRKNNQVEDYKPMGV
jgi:hypothetical protein